MAGGKIRMCVRLLILVNFITVFTTQITVAQVDDLDKDEEAVVEVEEIPNEYVSAEPSDRSDVYFYENFDDPDRAKKRWIISSAKKEDKTGSKYEGVWEFQLPQHPIFAGKDRALVLKSRSTHAAISAKLDRPFEFKTKPLFIQYEVNFQNGMECGGAYIKLLSQSKGLDLVKFTDKTNYTIMFGPDKCGNDYKLHFIFRHKNPLTGEFEEKHAAKPASRLEENYSDKKPHLYLLKLFPDNTFQIYVDGALVNSGNLLEDLTPPVNPPIEISDEADMKPTDWDDREKIPDPTSTKPEDWDEDSPAMIPDPMAQMPDGWLEDVEPMLNDDSAKKPEDWDDNMDGEWELPKINNPACADAPGCGPWTVPQISNPAFKGKWKPPMISNPEYRGKWSPRMIPNPQYFEDKEPFKMTSIGAVGIEIWTVTDLILFDNFVITDSESVLQDWTAKTFDMKKRIIDKDSEGVFSRTFNYTNAHPWLWAVYLVVIALPLVLILTFCCGGSQDKRDDARSKKTDEYVEDDVIMKEGMNEEPEEEPNTASTAASPSTSSRSRTIGKEDLELDGGAMGDGDMKGEEDQDGDSESDLSDLNIVDTGAETDTDSEMEMRMSQQREAHVTTTSSLQKNRSRRVD